MANTGSKIKTLRESANLSVDELAERSDLDAAVISDLEAGNLAPSLAPLVAITRALGVRLGTLMDDDNELGPVVTRKKNVEDPTVKAKALQTFSDAGTLDFFSLAEGKASRHTEPFFIVAHPITAEEHELKSHEGEEFMYVLDGALEIEYGKDTYILEAGDSIYYDTVVPHQVRAHEGQATFVAVVYTPH